MKTNYVYEPCLPNGEPNPNSPPYSYYTNIYTESQQDAPSRILSREFTNQIYKWCSPFGTQDKFNTMLSSYNFNRPMVLRLSYN